MVFELASIPYLCTINTLNTIEPEAFILRFAPFKKLSSILLPYFSQVDIFNNVWFVVCHFYLLSDLKDIQRHFQPISRVKAKPISVRGDVLGPSRCDGPITSTP